MPNFMVGNGSVCQAAEQSAWGTSKTPDTLINMTSESITVSYQKGDEANLIAKKTASSKELLAIVTEGGLSTILRPDFADWVFKVALGKGSSGVYTLQDPNTDLPVSTIVMKRGSIVETYPDVHIRSLALDCVGED